MNKQLLNKRIMNLGFTLLSVIAFYVVYVIGCYISGTMAALNYVNGYGISNTVFGFIVDGFIVVGVIVSNYVNRKLRK